MIDAMHASLNPFGLRYRRPSQGFDTSARTESVRLQAGRRKHKRCYGLAIAAAGTCVLTAALATTAQAQGTPGVDLPPLPGPERPIAVPAFEEQRLPNGLRVVVARRANLPIVSAALQVQHAGSVADLAGKAGLADMTATLLTKGARRNGRLVDATQIARQAEALGSTLNAGAGHRATLVSMTVNTAKLPAALALIADVVRQPTLAQAELDRARTLAVDGLKVTLSDPGALSGLVARRSFWGASAYGSITTPATLAQIARTDVQAFHRRWMRPEHATMIFAGDITLAQAVQLTQRTLGGWSAPKDGVSAPAASAAAPAAPRTVLVNLPGSGQSGVVVTAPYVSATSPERRAGQVAQAVLGGGYSARINQEIRIKRGLSYGAGAGAEAHPIADGVAGMLSASAQTNHTTAAQVAELLRGEIVRVATEPPGADELAARQATIVGSFGRQLETTGGLAGVVAEQIANGRALADVQKLPAEINAITAQQVRDFAAKHWPRDALRTVVVGDVKAAGEALMKLDDKPLVAEAGQLDLREAGLGVK
jgi:zinc protease